MEANDVGVPQGGRDLNLTLDVNSVQVFDDTLLTDRLDSHLTEKMHYGESVLEHMLKTEIYSSQTELPKKKGQRRTGDTVVPCQVVVAHFHKRFGANKPRFLFNLKTKHSLRKFLFIPLMRPLGAQDSEQLTVQHVVHFTA